MKKTYFNVIKNILLLLSYFLLIEFIIHKIVTCFFYAEPHVLQTAYSPDGHYVAYVFESNGGATSGFTYHLSILENGKKLKKGNGNTHISNYSFSVRWIANDVLEVYDTSDKFLHKDYIKGIHILYCYSTSS